MIPRCTVCLCRRCAFAPWGGSIQLHNPTNWLLVPLTILMVTQIACGGRGANPLAQVPAQASSLVVLESIERTSARIPSIVDRMPETSGLVDLVRSVAGIDFLSNKATRSAGIDSRRPVVVATVSSAVWILVPVDNEARIVRRMALVLARFGYLEQDESGLKSKDVRSARTFGREGLTAKAVISVTDGVARLCLGQPAGCAEEVASSGPWPGRFDQLVLELGIAEPDIVAWAGSTEIQRILGQLTRFDALPLTARMVVMAAIGEFRTAVSFDGDIRVRAGAGAVGPPIEHDIGTVSLPSGLAVWAGVDLREINGQILQQVFAMCGRACTASNGVTLPILVADWSRLAEVRVCDTGDGPPVGLMSIVSMMSRLSIGLSLPFSSAEKANRALMWLADILRVSAEDRALSGDRLDSISTKLVGAIPLTAAGRDSVLELAVGRVTSCGREARLYGEQAGHPVTAVFSPASLAVGIGASRADFIRHMAESIRLVSLVVGLDDGRMWLDLALKLR